VSPGEHGFSWPHALRGPRGSEVVPVSVAARAAALVVAVLAVVGVGIFIVIYFIGGQSTQLATVNYTASHGQVNLVLQEDPQNTVSSRPDWVTYFVQDPKTHKWVHTTLFSLPKDVKVNVTIYGYDGCTALRNNFWSGVQGTIGGTANVQQFNKGRPLGPARNVSVINSWSSCNVGHTFAISSLHLFVPVPSPPTALQGSLCGTSPCTPSSGPYGLVKFSFMSPDHTGSFRWQCLVPCGGGFIDGNSGPMQTVGFMTGFMQVVA
jgi:hypothetical protein